MAPPRPGAPCMVTPGSRLSTSPTVLSPKRSISSRPTTILAAVDRRRSSVSLARPPMMLTRWSVSAGADADGDGARAAADAAGAGRSASADVCAWTAIVGRTAIHANAARCGRLDKRCVMGRDFVPAVLRNLSAPACRRDGRFRTTLWGVPHFYAHEITCCQRACSPPCRPPARPCPMSPPCMLQLQAAGPLPC